MSDCQGRCFIHTKTLRCTTCGKSLEEAMEHLKVPTKDQAHTINWLKSRRHEAAIAQR